MAIEDRSGGNAAADGEVDALSHVLDPITDGELAEPALITGPSGAGKTTIATFVIGRLRESILDVAAVHVNCWQSYSQFKAGYRIFERLGQTVDVHRQSTPHDELLDRLAAYDGPPVIVTLDGVDASTSYDVDHYLESARESRRLRRA